jgi:protein farnesyltransferase subunit beta
MAFEGGFQGRTNKLVDGCYSFWVGALLPLIQAVQRQKPIRDNQGYYDHFLCI